MRINEQMLRTTASVRCCPSTKMSMVFRCGLDPRCKAISFMTCQSERRWSVVTKKKIRDSSDHLHLSFSSLDLYCRMCTLVAFDWVLWPCLWRRFQGPCRNRRCLDEMVRTFYIIMLRNRTPTKRKQKSESTHWKAENRWDCACTEQRRCMEYRAITT